VGWLCDSLGLWHESVWNPLVPHTASLETLLLPISLSLARVTPAYSKAVSFFGWFLMLANFMARKLLEGIERSGRWRFSLGSWSKFGKGLRSDSASARRHRAQTQMRLTATANKHGRCSGLYVDVRSSQPLCPSNCSAPAGQCISALSPAALQSTGGSGSVSVCECQAGFAGDMCQGALVDVQLGEPVRGLVMQGGWYAHTLMHTPPFYAGTKHTHTHTRTYKQAPPSQAEASDVNAADVGWHHFSCCGGFEE
jgi:hypothetical protein